MVRWCEDMDSQANAKVIEDIMWLEDEDFEKAVKELDLRSILCLMEALQTSMCEEQLQFEHLTRQLQKYPDRNSHNHRKISAALCTAQSLLTNLCTKHMICSSQCETSKQKKQAFRSEIKTKGKINT
ncbi:uncharacterized protein TNCT_262191 [Trichonephila clavata]|uniref:Uncharacterized protein n=1 Tax=Trichonephila clavata TaxID=2740835 RepID=A0A8X6M2I6_TRICU|nr:uncharacterized protein TNCT_262191 [Trichonephila clavata]